MGCVKKLRLFYPQTIHNHCWQKKIWTVCVEECCKVGQSGYSFRARLLADIEQQVTRMVAIWQGKEARSFEVFTGTNLWPRA